MANDLTIAENVYVSVPKDDAEAEHILRRVMGPSFRELGVLRTFNLPSEGDRAILRRRRDVLIKSFEFDADKVGLMVAQLLRGYREKLKSNDDPQLLAKDVRIFQRELANDPPIPTWAVALATGAIRNGEVPEFLIFPPSTMALRALCDKFVWKARAEIGNISSALNAQLAPRPVSDAEREEVGGKLSNLAREMRERLEANQRKEALLTEQQLVEMAGGQAAWDSIETQAQRDERRGRVAKTLGALADKYVKENAAKDDALVGRAAAGARPRAGRQASR